MESETLRAPANGIEIAYDTFGNRGDPAILLIMGLGTQMIAWPEFFCQDLADAGFFVIRFDNRDVGHSTYLTGETPSLTQVVLRRKPPAYSLDDMAGDATGLLDALDLDRAHIVGASLGGFIAQTLVLRSPERVLSMTLMMTSTGSRKVGQPKPALIKRLLQSRDIADREDAIEVSIDVLRSISSPGYPVDEQLLRELVARSYDRGHNPAGRLRQLTAAAIQPNRTRDLATVQAPTTVLHGLHDPLIGVSGGIAVARAIPGAKFVGYSGMGHDLPRPLIPRIANEIIGLARGVPLSAKP
jgi:pimeloyl-ACP methyl ester carboxylesterase